MNVLISGGAGFIGSHLAERLVKDGHDVVVLDDLSTGSLSNIAKLKKQKNFKCTIGSVQDKSLVMNLVEKCDIVIHLAAAVGVKFILEHPSYSIHNNVIGTENILYAAANRKKKVFIASSSEVYGKSVDIPFSEENDLVLGSTANLRWSYACAKALDECMALAYSQENKVDVIVGRLFNTTGPRQSDRYGMVLPSFITQACNNSPITVYGTGEQSRSFCHVLDVVESIVRLIKNPDALGEIINIGNDREISILELAKLVKDVTGSRSKIESLPYEAAYTYGFEDMQRRVPDISKLIRYTGYRPKITLEKTILDIIEQMKLIKTSDHA